MEKEAITQYEIKHLDKKEIALYFPSLLEIPKPPQTISVVGDLSNLKNIQAFITIVGSRKPTPYGISALEHIIKGLSGYPICIVSGLAYGIDITAHKLALKYGIMTISAPGSGLNQNILYPSAHVPLAREIIEKGGLLLSEFSDTQKSAIWTFPQRNRIMAGLSELVICIEAEKKSGSMITTKFGSDFNKTVCAVPGSIFSSLSDGPNFLIKSGAFPITDAQDVLELLRMEKASLNEESTTLEHLKHIPKSKEIVEILKQGPINESELRKQINLSFQECSMALSLLEIEGIITVANNTVRLL